MLSAKKVTEVLIDCQYRDGEDQADVKLVDGIINKYGFNPERLEKNKQKIADLLSDLPNAFRKEHGGGWSFLNACVTKDGTQWGEQSDVENLLVLGIATDQAKYLVPRDMWKNFPGAMPYFVVY